MHSRAQARWPTYGGETKRPRSAEPLFDGGPDFFRDGLLGLRPIDHHETVRHSLCQNEIPFADLLIEIDILAFHPVREIRGALVNARQTHFGGDIDDDCDIRHYITNGEPVDLC